MPAYVTPGVYYERADTSGNTLSPLRTDIAGFVGMARRGPLHLALPVDSWRQFEATFGEFTGAAYLAYAVRAFFENGGRRCWVVRIASPAAVAARWVDPLAPAPPALHPWDVEASSPGVWGNDLDIEWRETHRAQTSADPLLSAPEFATVTSVTGFERGTHVRVLVQPAAPVFRVVAAVDADRRRLYWVNPDPRRRLAYEQPLIQSSLVRPVIESIEYTLLVRELGRVRAVFEDLSLVPDHPRYGPRLLPPPAVPEEGIATDTEAPRKEPAPVTVVERRSPATIALLGPLDPADLALRPLLGGRDGLAALSVADFVGEPWDPGDDILTRTRKRRGLRALEPIGEIALVAVPDIHIQPVAEPPKRPPEVCKPDPCLAQPPEPPAVPRVRSVGDLPPIFSAEQVYQVQQAQLQHCQVLHDRFAVLDPPFDAVREPGLGIGPMRAWRRRFDSDMGALYGPWLVVPDPLRLDATGLRVIPPSGHVTGFIAQTDRRTGVHRAPANGPLAWVQSVSFSIDDALQGILNPEHVNAIRPFAGRGIRIFGARTLSSDPSWRYVSVRRLLLMLEKAIRLGSQWATFEPNHRMTRAKLHLALTSLLLEEWRRGALAGKQAPEAFYVNCSEAQNPPDNRARGMLVAEVGVAPVKPFEFIVVRVGVSDNALEVVEAGAVESVA